MPAGPNTPWDERALEILRRGHAEGASFSTIAAEIGGGISRNACIGKAGRLGLVSRGGYNPQEKLSRMVAQAERRNKAKRERRELARLVPRAPPPSKAPIPLNVPLMEVRDGQCREVCGRGADKLAVFCGHPVVDGASYCPWHASVNFIQQ